LGQRRGERDGGAEDGTDGAVLQGLWLATVCGFAGPGDDDGVLWSVLVVDDHAEFRTSVRALLVADGFDVVGEAGTGAEALYAVGRLRPDVVLLDVKLPDVDGIAVAESVALLPDPPQVVLVSSRDRAAYGSRLLNAPVRGFLAKSDVSGASLRRLLG
jgi:DNA-binding NarL/FixJ family response regulator